MGPEFDATSPQIAAPVLAGASPVVGCWSDWNPLKDRDDLFPEPNLDRKDPWQFENFRVRR